MMRLCVLAAASAHQTLALLTTATASALSVPAAAPDVVQQLPSLSQVLGGSLQVFSSLAQDAEHLQADALTELAKAKAAYDQRLADQHNVTRSLEIECQAVAAEVRTIQKKVSAEEHEAAASRKVGMLLQKRLRGVQAALAAWTVARPAVPVAAAPAARHEVAAIEEAEATSEEQSGSAEDAPVDAGTPAANSAAVEEDVPAQDVPSEAAPPAAVAGEEDGASAAVMEADDAGNVEDAAAGGGYGVLSFLATDAQAADASLDQTDAEAFQGRLTSLSSEISRARDLQQSALAKLRNLFQAEFSKEQLQQNALKLQLKKLRVVREGLLVKQRKTAAMLKKWQELQKSTQSILKQVSADAGGS